MVTMLSVSSLRRSRTILESIERKVGIASQYARSFDNRHLAVL